jgi:hypothetical protein
MLGSNDKMPLPAIAAGQAAYLSAGTEIYSGLAAPPASSFAPRRFATTNCENG